MTDRCVIARISTDVLFVVNNGTVLLYQVCCRGVVMCVDDNFTTTCDAIIQIIVQIIQVV